MGRSNKKEIHTPHHNTKKKWEMNDLKNKKNKKNKKIKKNKKNKKIRIRSKHAINELSLPMLY
ncbi:hypothetical protein [Aeromonas jandaei]|uniref:hypothetical protein n=1 Tax=Aeromonas jandaei TaxID=650 RepID=UPI003BA04497